MAWHLYWSDRWWNFSVDPRRTLAKYESTECKDLIVTSANGSEQTPYKLSNGEMMNPAGRSGCFYNDELVLSPGFSVRKYLDP